MENNYTLHIKHSEWKKMIDYTIKNLMEEKNIDELTATWMVSCNKKIWNLKNHIEWIKEEN